MELRPLGADECQQLAVALGYTSDTTVEVHSLERGLCRAFTLGAPGAFDAALVETENLAAEPHGFADDPADLCSLLEKVQGWDCVLVASGLAEPLEQLVRKRITPNTRIYESVHAELHRPAGHYVHPSVRGFDTADLPFLEVSSRELGPDGFATIEECVTVGSVAGAFIDGEIVSVAYVDSLTSRFGAVTINTMERHRGQGLATAAASIVAKRLQSQGRMPVWYTGADNASSLRVAAKLGFSEVSRPKYVVRS